MWCRIGYKGRKKIYGYDLKRAGKLSILEKVLQERYDKALEMQTEIETYINKIDRSDIRQILGYRYIDNFSWIKIMHLMRYDSEDIARKKHDRFLEKI